MVKEAVEILPNVLSLLNSLKVKIRINLLKMKGVKIGKNAYIAGDSVFDSSFPWLISVGDNVTISSRARILTHDACTKRHLNKTKIGMVSIGNNVFIGADSTVLPNVKIGDNSVIGAGSVVAVDIPENSVAAGVPAKVMGQTSKLVAKHRKLMKSRPVYDGKWTLGGGISQEKKQKMREELKSGIGYID